MRLFDKIKNDATRLFGKVKSQAPKLLGKVSQGLKQASGIVNQFEGVGRGIINDPTVQRLAGDNKTFTQAKSVLDKGLSTQILKGASGLSDVGNYKGDAQGITANILERAKKIGQNVQDATGSKMEFV